MANLGGWYLNNKGVLEYRLLDGDGNQTTTVLASVAGLANLKAGTGEDAEKVLVKTKDENSGETEWTAISDSDIKITGESGSGTTADKGKGTIAIGSSLLGTSKITVTGNSKLYDAYLNLQDADDKVHIEGTEEITKNTTAGTAVVTGDLSKGFTLNKLDGTATQATYSDAKTNQTLATVSGLAKGYSDSTVELDETERDGDEVTAGTITLSKASDKVSALGTTVIKVAMSNIANANGIAYYLALNEGQNETYAQVAANDEPAYWTVKGTTATYQYVSPTGYQLANAAGTLISNVGEGGDTNATQVKITAAKTTVVATVTGLAADLTTNITDGNQYPTEVGTGRSRITGEFKSGITVATTDEGKLKKPTYKEDGKTLATDNDGNVTGKGSVTINISKVALPTSGTVTVTAGKDFTVSTTPGDDFNKAEADGSAPDVVKDQYIWVVSGNKAIYEKVDLAYYTVTDKKTDKNGSITTEENLDKNGNKITRIICKPQGKATVLATISGLDADYLANEDNLVRGVEKDTNGVITHIKGINATDGTAAVTEGKTVKKAAIPGEIVLSKEVLGTTNVSLAKSDNYRLALATAANSTDEKSAVDLPKFSNYKWNLIGTTATLKGTVTAGYTASDDGKLITYTAGGDNQTLATISGLKKGTQLNKGASDARTIGNDINGTFTAGVVAGTSALTHKSITMTNTTSDATKYTIKALERLPITLSKHVMEGKVTLNSNFFTLAINQDITDGATLTQKADSRTYVLTKGELYDETTNAKNQKVYTPKEEAKAIVGWHGSLGATAILKTTTPACYELATDTYGTTKTINYTAPPKAITVATVKGLNSAITEDDISFDTKEKTITINNANALTTGNVTITSTDYTLAIKESATGITNPKLKADSIEWSQATNGTVSFKAIVTGTGYELNADGTIITYTKAASTPTTLATITGLRTDLDKLEPTDDSDSDSDSDGTGSSEGAEVPETTEASWQFNGVKFEQDKGTITLSKSALGTAKAVVLSGAGNYKLEVDSSTVDTTKKEAKDAADRWVISGTNAILKKVIPDYYTLNGNTLTYTAPTDVKYQKTDKDNKETYDVAKAGKSIIYGTIQGLKSGLTVDADGKKIGYYKDGKFVEAIVADATDAKKLIIKDAGVLDYKNSVKLDKTATEAGYKIYLDTTIATGATESLADQLKPGLKEGSTTEWTVSRGTATYKGNIEAGYANGDGTIINFSAAKNGATIATITGLNTTLINSDVTEGLTFGEDKSGEQDGKDESNIITVNADMLGTTDAKLTTNIAILGTDYKLALGGTVPTETSIENTNKNIWTIDSTNATSTTATYGTWKDTHYALDSSSGTGKDDVITYHKAGVADSDKIVTVKGLAGNLVTIQNDQIRGITVGGNVTETVDGKSVTSFKASEDGKIIQLSSTVLPTTVGNAVELTKGTGVTGDYELVLDSTEVTSGVIPTPQENVIKYKISKADSATVTITKETSAGFVYEGDKKYNTSSSNKTKLVYMESAEPTGNNKTGTITGLSKNISNNDDGTITGINIKNENIIVLSKNVLAGDVTLTSNDYTLELGEDVTSYTSDPVWESTATKGTFNLYAGITSSGYTLGDDAKSIKYKPGGDKGAFAATVTGLKNTSNVKFDGTQIIISAGSLNAQDVSIKKAENYTGEEFTLALNNAPVAEGESKPAGYVDASTSTKGWTLTNGTATFTQTVTAGYGLVNGEIIYTAPSSIVSTFTNFNKALTSDNYTISKDGTMLITNPTEEDETKQHGIKFVAGDEGKGTFTITDPDLLAHKNVKLTTKATGTTADYTIALGDDVAAHVDNPVWNKATNATVATYTQTTAAGYSLDSTSKNIVYSSDPTTVTLATVSGLNKESVVNSDGTAIGIATTTTTTDPTSGEETETTTVIEGLKVTTPATSSAAGEITISGNVLNNAKVTLGKNDNYTFALDETQGNAVPQSTNIATTTAWAQNRTTAIYKNVTPAYYTLNETTGKEIIYTKEADYKKTSDTDTTPTTIVTITGLKSGITINPDGTVGTDSAKGLEVEDTVVTLYSAVLGTTKIASDNYTFELGDGVMVKRGNKWKEQTEWVDGGKGSYTFKTYDKAYYTVDTEAQSKEVNYTPAKDITAYATISGLKTGLTNANIGFTATDTSQTPDYSKGGKLTLGASQLGTGTVKLTTTTKATGDFELALDTTTVDESKITSGSEVWTTKTTTATLTGLKTKGYTVSEDKKSITYQADAKTVTLATVKGIKSGAEIALTDISDELEDPTDENSAATGNKIITLKADQLGTSNVTVTGDGYKLAIDSGAKSQTDDAAWVKAANATKATFTQTTYNGFRESTDGKSLIYQKNTGNVDLATINGLNKTITQDDMAIIADANKLTTAFTTDKKHVVINTTTKEIYLDKEALTTSAVTLGKNDDYTLKLYNATNGVIGGETTTNGLVFDKSTGTMSITTGDAAKWEETNDGKSLKYTKDTYKNAATITGLPKNLTYTEDSENGNKLNGITIGEADGDGKIAITIEKSAVSDLTGGSKITLTNYPANGGGNYTLDIGETESSTFTSVSVTSTPTADHKKWVASTKNLTLKEVTSAHYLKSTDTKKNQEIITYVAEKVGSDLAVITGLPTDIKTNTNGTKVYLSDGSTELFTNTLSGTDAMEDNKITITSDFIGAKDSLTKALTINLASKKSTPTGKAAYVFDDTGAITDTEIGPKKGTVEVDEKTFETTSTKGTAILQQHTNAGWERVSDTQIKFTTASDAVVATFNGLNKNFTYKASGDDANSGVFALTDTTVTLKDELLTNSNVTVTMPKGATTPYTLTIGSDVATEAAETTSWAVSGGTATYKTYDQAYYTTKDNGTGKPNSIIYNAPTKGTAYASITGLNKTITSVDTADNIEKYDKVEGDEIVITLGATELEGTTKVVLANAGAKKVAYPRNADKAKEEEIDEQNKKIEGHNKTAAKFKLALDTEGDNSVTESSIANAVWDNNGKVATLTGTIQKGYRLSNDQKTITYQAKDSKLQTIAKVIGIKTGSQITDNDVAAITDTDDKRYNENLPNLQYITLKGEHLGTDNVVLTGEGYKLALDDDVIEASETEQWQNQTEWVNNNGTFVYKTYNKGYYTLDENTGMRVNYTAAKDDTKTAGTQHKTYLTISGLSKTATPTLAEAGDVDVDNSTGAISVTTKADGVITLTDAELNKANVKLTDSQNGGYSLALDEHVTKSTVSNDSAVISGTKATWTGTQGKGYLLANDEQSVTYYSAAKTKQTIATVTGLASTVTSANNDTFSGKYDAATNTVSLAEADLGDKVTVGGTATFSFKDDLTGRYVTGSKDADKMTFAAGGNSINAGGGNDVIDVASKGSNVFFYANGNGNDVISGFTVGTDVIRVTNVVGTTSKTTTKTVDGEKVTEETYTNNIEVYQDDKIAADAIVRVNKNYIRLKNVDLSDGDVKIYDSKGNIWSTSDDAQVGDLAGSFIEDTNTSSEGANVFADDNYAMTPNLSSIVKSSTASYATDDLTADDATALTKQSTAISYSDKK